MAEVKLIDFGLSTQFFETEKELTDGVGTMYVLSNIFLVRRIELRLLTGSLRCRR
jgi:hypothetical protein